LPTLLYFFIISKNNQSEEFNWPTTVLDLDDL
jgi:hypothetical protein